MPNHLKLRCNQLPKVMRILLRLSNDSSNLLPLFWVQVQFIVQFLDEIGV